MRLTMNPLRRTFFTLRTWLGLGDTADDHLTPSHGWLLPDPEAAVAPPKDGASAPTEPPLL
jgi:hypothetical protein